MLLFFYLLSLFHAIGTVWGIEYFVDGDEGFDCFVRLLGASREWLQAIVMVDFHLDSLIYGFMCRVSRSIC